MAETTVENRVCSACGADVRSKSLFCYSCGKSVAPDIVTDLSDKKNLGDVQTRENTAEGENGFEQREQTITKESADKPILKPALIENPPLKSAAAVRRKSKPFQPKRVQIIWEEYESAPNGWFILAAILLTLFAVGVLYLTFYLK